VFSTAYSLSSKNAGKIATVRHLRHQLSLQAMASRHVVGWKHLGPAQQEESGGIDELLLDFERVALA
jgi:hypothetical protein